MLELCKCGSAVQRCQLRELRVGSGPTVLVDRDPAGDGVRPCAKVLTVTELWVGAQRAEERLLKRVLCTCTAESAHQEREDLLAVLFVKALEGRQRHRRHLE